MKVLGLVLMGGMSEEETENNLKAAAGAVRSLYGDVP
jgi:hypothetical protein